MEKGITCREGIDCRGCYWCGNRFSIGFYECIWFKKVVIITYGGSCDMYWDRGLVIVIVIDIDDIFKGLEGVLGGR